VNVGSAQDDLGVKLRARAEELRRAGRALEAIEELSVANRNVGDPHIERCLVRLRHAAWAELDRKPPLKAATDEVPDLFKGDTGIPEVAASEVTAVMIRSAVQHHGSLVVRGLFSPEWCARLRNDIDRSWDAFERFRASKQTDPAWFDPMDTDAYGLTMRDRSILMAGGTGYVPDSPRLMFDLLEAFDAAGVKRMVGDYFGEPPALSLVKLAQRRLAPDATGGWHQDAAVYGKTAETLNVWVAVSRCGDVAPGLEMFPRRLEELVGTRGVEGVDEYAALTDEVALLTDEVAPARPIFGPGDAAVFDQLLLHQTAASSEFTEMRYGFESWFFAPSTYPDPDRWIPLTY
jgi:Phytanoyl-CoA dioxygenase (PhyH)